MIDRFYQDRFEEDRRLTYNRFGRLSCQTEKDISRVSEKPKKADYVYTDQVVNPDGSVERPRTEFGYVCIDQVVNPDGSVERPRTEFEVGDLEKIKEFGSEYEKKKKSYVMLTFHDNTDETTVIAKIYISDDHEEMDRNLLNYINRVKCNVINQMRKRNPDCDLGAVVSVHYCNDRTVFDRIKKSVKAEEIVSYEF